MLIRDRLRGLGIRWVVRQIELAARHLHGDRGPGCRRSAVAAALRAGMVGSDAADGRLPREIPDGLDDRGVVDHAAAVLRPYRRATQGGRNVGRGRRASRHGHVLIA